MTLTQIFNHIYCMACVLGVLLAMPEFISIVPEKYKPAVGALSVFAAWIKAARNLNINPDGKPAQEPYEPPKK